MKVRNRLLKEKDYKGHWVNGVDAMCPCRPCFNVHDCGYINGKGEWIKHFSCATNYNNGCPYTANNELLAPMHIIRSKIKNIKKGQIRKCLRCGEKVVLGECNFMTIEAYNIKERRCDGIDI